MSTSITSLQSALQSLPLDATEAIVSDVFSIPLLHTLGFRDGEIIPQYDTGGGITDKSLVSLFIRHRFTVMFSMITLNHQEKYS